MTEQELFKEKALSGYTVCFAEQCPLKGHCLHYLVGQQLPDSRSTYHCVNPHYQNVGTEQCSLFRQSAKVKFARGMMHIFNNDEVARIQQLNQGYMEQKDIVEIIKVCFRKPEEGEHVKSMNTSELLGVIQDKYPTVPDTMSTRVRLCQAMKLLEYDSTSRGHTSYYKEVPLKAA